MEVKVEIKEGKEKVVESEVVVEKEIVEKGKRELLEIQFLLTIRLLVVRIETTI